MHLTLVDFEYFILFNDRLMLQYASNSYDDEIFLILEPNYEHKWLNLINLYESCVALVDNTINGNFSNNTYAWCSVILMNIQLCMANDSSVD